jgi:hypothetical protein
MAEKSKEFHSLKMKMAWTWNIYSERIPSMLSPQQQQQHAWAQPICCDVGPLYKSVEQTRNVFFQVKRKKRNIKGNSELYCCSNDNNSAVSDESGRD